MTDLVLEDCRVDLLRQRVYRGDESVGLTTMERRLLAYLVRHANQVVARETLLEEVWEYSGAARTHTVRTTVNRLRAKIEPEPSTPTHLQTVRGQGYLLRCEVQEAKPEVTARSNLTVLPSVFVGRSVELRLLRDFLSTPGALVTIHGPGGMGKTTLASRFASTQHAAYPGGVWFCDLAAARTAPEVAECLARALGVERVMEDVDAQVVGLLGARPATLIVLDNFEQLVETAAADLQAWRRAAPEVRWLVTSRHRLCVASEQVVPLGVLSVEEASAMYTERAQETIPSWVRKPERAAALARVVEMLEGIPLAIDLAASRAGLLPPEVLVDRLGVVDEMLRSRRRDRPERHHTLTATLLLSWSLLSPHEQQLVSQLGVFRGGFRLEAAEAVLDLPPDTPWVADVLEGLIEKSWLQRVEAPSGVRFRCLELVRRFVMTKLRERGGVSEVVEVELRHARHYGRCAEIYERIGMLQHPVLKERENLLGALEATVTRGWSAVAAKLALVFGRRCLSLGPLSEGRRWVSQVRAMRGHTVGHQARLLHIEGMLLDGAGMTAEALGRYESALALDRQHGDRQHEGVVLRDLGIHFAQRGFLAEADAYYEACLAAARAVGDRFTEGLVLNNLGNQFLDRGHLEDARAHYEMHLDWCRELGTRGGEACVLGNLGLVHRLKGQLDMAAECYDASLAIHREIGHLRGEGQVLGNQGNLRRAQGRLDEARACYDAALVTHRRFGSRRLEGFVLLNLGDLAIEQGRPQEGWGHYETSLVLLREVGDRGAEGHALGRMARARAILGDAAGARDLLAPGEALLREVNDPSLLAQFLGDRAEVLWRSGDRGGAEASLVEADRTLPDGNQDVAELLAQVRALLEGAVPREVDPEHRS